ncbi:hypothetical protein Tco_0520928 [Tanacetum coccineum]
MTENLKLQLILWDISGNVSQVEMIKLHQFLAMEIWFNDRLLSKGLFRRRVNPIYSPLFKLCDAIWKHVMESCLSHLNFDTINLLSNNNIVNGLLTLKFVKDHLCSSCEPGKAKRKSFHTKTPPSSKRTVTIYTWTYVVQCVVERLMEKKLCSVIVDDYSRILTHFLGSKSETPGVLIASSHLSNEASCSVTTVRTDKGTLIS